MKSGFEILDWRQTSIGTLVLRRRVSPSMPGEPVYEVKIDEEMLMSSSINSSERALARIAIEKLRGSPCEVLVGGLGLGYSAAEALEFDNVRSVAVVELLEPVIEWHRRRLVPMAGRLLDDPRCSIVQGDFFEHIRASGEAYDAILLDIDHSPDSWLHERHGDFYEPAGLGALSSRLRPGGVFALWSAFEPEEGFLDRLRAALAEVEPHVIHFHNPHNDEDVSNWIITARRPG